MQERTKITAEPGKQDLVIAREFELPVELLFKAYMESDIVEQWMGTKVLTLDSKKHGSYQFETSDPQGNVVFKASGAIHDVIQDKKIVRTFEMEGTPFGIQLEFYEFEALTEATSKLKMHVIYESPAQRDQLLSFGLSQGINMAHNRLQDVAEKLK
jgi:uncharacterized protein YndB with AHSA1/START domain